MTLAAVSLGVGCGDGGVNEEQAGPPGYGPAHEALCAARRDVARGDVARARDRFHADAHQPLHDLAAETAQADRPVAARLLEAKEAVEAGLGRASPTLADDLSRLASATRDAVAATGATAPPPCERG